MAAFLTPRPPEYAAVAAARRRVGVTLMAAGLLAGALAPACEAHAAGQVTAIGTAQVAGARQFADLNAYAKGGGCVHPGDQILLQSGQQFFGTLRLRLCATGAGGEDLRIVVRNYDPAAPMSAPAGIPAARIDTGRTLEARGLAWRRLPAAERPAGMPALRDGLDVYAAGPFPGEDPVAELFVGGQRQAVARTPDALAAGGGSLYLTASRITDGVLGCPRAVCLRSDAASAHDAVKRLATAGAAGLKGAYAIVRTSAWSLGASPLAEVDADSGEVRLAKAVTGPGLSSTRLPWAGFGFILAGSPAFLDAAGEWVFDDASRQVLLVWNRPDPPTAASTLLTTRALPGPDQTTHGDAAVAFWGGANGQSSGVQLEIAGLEIAHAAGAGIRVRDAGAVDIHDVRIRLPGGSGIVINGVEHDVRIDQVVIDRPPDNGVLVHDAPTITVTRTTVEQPGRILNQRSFGMDMAGIRLMVFHAGRVSDNVVRGAGYAGIMLGELPQNDPRTYDLELDVSNNRIEGFCTVLNDCGGIYIHGHDKVPPPKSSAPSSLKRVVGNVLSGPVGNQDGTPGGSGLPVPPGSKAGADVRLVGALYFDHKASGYDVSGNRISGRYEPYSWRVLVGGTLNSCSRDMVARCAGLAYACYTKALPSCNELATESR